MVPARVRWIVQASINLIIKLPPVEMINDARVLAAGGSRPTKHIGSKQDGLSMMTLALLKLGETDPRANSAI